MTDGEAEAAGVDRRAPAPGPAPDPRRVQTRRIASHRVAPHLTARRQVERGRLPAVDQSPRQRRILRAEPPGAAQQPDAEARGPEGGLRGQSGHGTECASEPLVPPLVLVHGPADPAVVGIVVRARIVRRRVPLHGAVVGEREVRRAASPATRVDQPVQPRPRHQVQQCRAGHHLRAAVRDHVESRAGQVRADPRKALDAVRRRGPLQQVAIVIHEAPVLRTGQPRRKVAKVRPRSAPEIDHARPAVLTPRLRQQGHGGRRPGAVVHRLAKRQPRRVEDLAHRLEP